MELAALGRGDESGIGHRTPEKIRESGGQFPFANTVTGLWRALDEVNEMPGSHYALHGNSVGVDGLFSRLALSAVRLQKLHQLLIFHRPSPSAFGKALQIPGHHLGRRLIGRHQAYGPGPFFFRHQRSFPFNPIEQHCGEKSVAPVVEHLRRIGIQEQGLAAVREHVAGARQRVAEGRALSPVHHIRRHHAEIERRWHLKKQLELINLRTVLWSREIKLDESCHRLLSGPLANAQVGRLTSGRTNAAGLDPHFVETTVLRPCLAQPVRRERGLDLPGKEEITQRPLDAEALQHRPLFFAPSITQFGGVLADFASLAGHRRKRAIED